MRIDDFTLENWLNPACDSEKNKYYLGGSCVFADDGRRAFRPHRREHGELL